MMTKVRTFSVYLLKPTFNDVNSLKEAHSLEGDYEANSIPAGASLYVLDGHPKPPWWSEYLQVQGDISQETKGAILFVPSGSRVFAFCFGHVAHNLKDYSYEYDFGLRVTLNSLDPKELKSTDTLEPGAARRRRTQLSTGSEITLFDFDRDSTVVKSLTGKVKQTRKHLFKHATGASDLRIGLETAAGGLPDLAKELLEIYMAGDFKTEFPDIQMLFR